MTETVYEGTWEEILRRSSELTGRRVRVTVLAEEPAKAGGAEAISGEGQSLAEALAGLVGQIDSAETFGDVPSRLSEDETSFGEYLARKHREGRL